MAFPLSVMLSYGQEKVETSGKKQKLGTRGTTPDGRVFYYALNGTAAITTAGMLVDSAAVFAVAAHDMDVPANANAAGVTAVSVEVPTTDLTLNQYADGYMIFNDGPGEGEVYRIKSHPVHDASDDNTVIITIDEPDGLRTATTTSSLFGLLVNPYSGVKLIDGDGTAETGVLGVTTIPVTASYYCWLQTAGIGAVRMGAQVGVVGDALTVSQESNESGCAERADHSDESDLATIGTAIGIPSIGGTALTGDSQACLLTIRY